jgi:hypothetical protein
MLTLPPVVQEILSLDGPIVANVKGDGGLRLA